MDTHGWIELGGSVLVGIWVLVPRSTLGRGWSALVGLGAVVFLVIEAFWIDWRDPLTYVGLVVGVLLIALFVLARNWAGRPRA